MGQPVKLSDALVLNARLTAEVCERSVASQIEFWAGIGHAVESLLRFDDVVRLKRLGQRKPLADCLSAPGSSEGRQALRAVLDERPYPHFEPAEKAGFLVKIDADGTRTVGRFIHRQFVAAQ